MATLIEPEIISEFQVCLLMEANWQTFRRMHGIGDGTMHRRKFLQILNQQAEEWERSRVKVYQN